VNGVLAAWLVEVGLIAYRDVKNKRSVAGLPVPGDFLATFVVFGTLSAIGNTQSGGRFASVAAWGFVVATFLNVLDPTLANGIAASITGKGAGIGASQTSQAGVPVGNAGPRGTTSGTGL